jgi:Ca-activated chloride channel family protein
MKKMIRRSFPLFLVMVFVITSLSGCSKSSKSDFSTSATDTSGSNAQANYANAEPAVGSDIPDNSAPLNDGNQALTDSSKGTSKVSAEAPEMPDEVYGMENNKIIMENEADEFNMEEYNAIVENDFVSVKNNPLSTFSIDVDTASYSNIRRMIKENRQVEPDAVRLEEMINYFNYDYSKPVFGEPFSVNTELSDCPWNADAKLLLVGLQAKDIDLRERPSSNIVFLLDVSGSMNEPDKLPLVQKAFLMLTENLNENDRISIVTYAGEDSVVLEGARGNETKKKSHPPLKT